MDRAYLIRVHYRTLAMDYAAKSTPLMSRVPGYVHYMYSSIADANERVRSIWKVGIKVAQKADCGSLVRHIPPSRILAVDFITCRCGWEKDDIPTVEETLRGV